MRLGKVVPGGPGACPRTLFDDTCVAEQQNATDVVAYAALDTPAPPTSIAARSSGSPSIDFAGNR